MTKLHLNRRLNRRFSALGLILSLALVFGASGIIRLDAAEHERASADAEELCEHASGPQRAELPSARPAVHFEGQPLGEHNL